MHGWADVGLIKTWRQQTHRDLLVKESSQSVPHSPHDLGQKQHVSAVIQHCITTAITDQNRERDTRAASRKPNLQRGSSASSCKLDQTRSRDSACRLRDDARRLVRQGHDDHTTSASATPTELCLLAFQAPDSPGRLSVPMYLTKPFDAAAVGTKDQDESNVFAACLISGI